MVRIGLAVGARGRPTRKEPSPPPRGLGPPKQQGAAAAALGLGAARTAMGHCLRVAWMAGGLELRCKVIYLIQKVTYSTYSICYIIHKSVLTLLLVLGHRRRRGAWGLGAGGGRSSQQQQLQPSSQPASSLQQQPTAPAASSSSRSMTQHQQPPAAADSRRQQ